MSKECESLFLILHRPSRNIVGEASTRAEAEAKLDDWLDYEREEAFEIVEVPHD